MNKKMNFVFVIHCHQPVGNFDFIFEDSFKKSYSPLLNVVKNHPGIKLTLHFSGILFEWIKNNHPDFIEMLNVMCTSGQVEIVGGGYYEPILTILPDNDKIGQVQKLNSFVKENLGVAPRGMWLAERVWEPSLTKPIVDAGQEYIILDDHHFKRSGVAPEDLTGYFLTEEQGRVLKVLPGSEMLRYLIPFHDPEETIEYLRKTLEKTGVNFLAMADDGEKFGIWPGTYKLVYEEKWLDKFFTLIEENSSWIDSVTCSEFLDANKPVGTVYVPTCSYREMDEWVLPLHMSNDLEKIVSGERKPGGIGEIMMAGVWRNFLTKYPEGNMIHKKMMHLSQKTTKLETIVSNMNGKSAKRKNGMLAEIEQIRDEVWKGQCNDIYWHGVFGGLYLPHMRTANYNSLVQAEVLLEKFVVKYEKSLPTNSFVEYEKTSVITKGDYNFDLQDEYMINTKNLFVYCDPQQGGTVYECGFKPYGFNVMSTLARREETYHKPLLEGAHKSENEDVTTIHGGLRVKEGGLDKHLCFDRREKRSLVDLFMKPGTSFEEFKTVNNQETSDFADGEYSAELNASRKTLNLSRVALVDGKQVMVSKKIEPVEDGISISYELHNQSKEILTTLFGVEFNINLLAGNAHDRYYAVDKIELDDNRLASTGVLEKVSNVNLVDEWLKLSVGVKIDKPFKLWRCPVETVSSSESGLEKVYQSSTIFPHWDLELAPSTVFKFKIMFMVEKL